VFPIRRRRSILGLI
jgi:hypothetical protein